MTYIERLGWFKKAFTFVVPNIEETFNWLINNNFFKAPASTKYHGSYEGGLFDHSRNVARTLIDMNLEWQRPESPLIIGFFHDLCKIDNYIEDPLTHEYSYNPNALYTGHGEKSVMLLSTLMQRQSARSST